MSEKHSASGMIRVALVDNPQAPDIFATAASGFLILGGNVVITFEALHANYSEPPGPHSRVVVGRLVMPLEGLQRFVAGLGDFLRQHDLDPAPETGGEHTRQ